MIGAALLLAGVVTWNPQAQKLNAPLPRQPGEAGGDVTAVAVSPVGGWCVYWADQETDGLQDLFSVPIDGSAASRKLSGGETYEAFDGPDFAIDAGGSFVVYRAYAANFAELFSAPIDGSAPRVRLHPPLVPGQAVLAFEITPDGTRVVYRASDPGPDPQLFVVPIDGSASPLRLSAGGAVGNAGLTPDGAHVVYRADEASPGVFELWSVPVDGSTAPVRVSLPLGGPRDARAFAITADGLRVVYLADQSQDEVVELCSVPLDPSSGLPALCTSMPAFADVTNFRLAPDGSALLFLADGLLDERFELFYAAADGSVGPLRVSGPLVGGGDVLEFRFSADGTRALYLADARTDEQVELFERPLDRSTPPLRLSPELIAAGDVAASAGGLLVQGTRVVFRADATLDGVFELYSVPADGGSGPVRLHPAQAAGRTVQDALLGALDGVRVLYTADPQAVGVFELWSVPVDGSAAPTPVSGDLGLTGDVLGLARPRADLTPDGQVVYLADQDVDEMFQAWAAPVEGTAAPRVLNGMLAAPPVVGDVTGFGWAAGGAHVLYLADQETDQLTELYSVQLAPRVGPERLNGDLIGDVIGPEYLGVGSFPPPSDTASQGLMVYADHLASVGYSGGADHLFAVPVDGSAAPVRIDEPATSNKGTIQIAAGRVLFVQYFTGYHPPPFAHLWSAPIDGSSPAIQISPQGNETVYLYRVTPDGARAVFEDYWDDSRLWSVASDGSASAVPLSVPGNLLPRSFEIVPPGERVVYVTYDYVANVGALWVTDIDGGGTPVQLTPPYPFGSSQVVDDGFRITSDGSRVVYVAEQDTAGVQELYVIPLAGGPSTKLSGPLVTGGDVLGRHEGRDAIFLSPDEHWVVYLADQDTDEVVELYAAPIDGSAPAVKLSPFLASGGDVERYSPQITSDSRRVVFLADAEVDGRLELYAAALDGSQPALKLNPPLVAGGSVANEYPEPRRAFQLGPHAGRVTYRADQDVDGRIELYSVALDGSAVPTKLNDPLVAGGNVRAFALHPDGRKVLYLADQELDETFELYLVESPAPPRPVRPAPAPTRTVSVRPE